MSSFGKRGQETGRFSGAQRPLAGNPVRPAAVQKPSPHVIYREGESESERFSFHNSYIERHWPKFGAGAFALLVLCHSLMERSHDPVTALLAALFGGGISFLVLSLFRRSVNNVHTARTEIFKSPRFAFGAALGLVYFVYSTFLHGPVVYDSDIAQAVAEYRDPLTPFRDGFQQSDLSAVATLILKAAGMMVAGGVIVRMIARRLLGEEAGSANNAG